jgi:hypothetical protein
MGGVLEKIGFAEISGVFRIEIEDRGVRFDFPGWSSVSDRLSQCHTGSPYPANNSTNICSCYYCTELSVINHEGHRRLGKITCDLEGYDKTAIRPQTFS